MISDLKIKLFADGADISSMVRMASLEYIQGLTTNPTLMHKAGVNDYREFAHSVLREVNNKPISFEVFADDFVEMNRQALEISSWGENVYVKIPITNTKGESSSKLIKSLTDNGVKVNVTAITTIKQVCEVAGNLNGIVPSYVSIFAGRIADTGVDPVGIVKETLSILRNVSSAEVIWASPREIYNVIQANDVGCHVITATPDILSKIDLLGYDLEQYSLDTVQMFYNDAKKSGLNL